MAFATNGTGGCTAIGNAIAAIYGLYYYVVPWLQRTAQQVEAKAARAAALAEKKAREEAEKAAFDAKIKARRQSTVKAPS